MGNKSCVFVQFYNSIMEYVAWFFFLNNLIKEKCYTLICTHLTKLSLRQLTHA